MGREFELKFAANEAALSAITGDGSGFETISMETAYYDTPDGALSRRKMTLRCRRENGVAVCTVKTPAGEFGRGEWELKWEDISTAVPELCKLGAPEELKRLASAGLVQVCGARFTRLAKAISLDGAAAELALDRGVLLGGGKEHPLCEVEVELKSGSEEAVVHYAAQLASQFGLVPEKKSKFRRALDLAKGE